MKFKFGDRVVMYSLKYGTVKGVVKRVNPESESLHIESVNNRILTAHPKQCRLLNPRAPSRRIWIKKEYLECVMDSETGLSVASAPMDESDIEFIEVRKKK